MVNRGWRISQNLTVPPATPPKSTSPPTRRARIGTTGRRSNALSIPTSRMSERVSVPEKPRALTRREQEIAALITRGLTNRQIASELSISEHTAATHVRRILKKLGLQSRAQIDFQSTEQRPSPRS